LTACFTELPNVLLKKAS